MRRVGTVLRRGKVRLSIAPYLSSVREAREYGDMREWGQGLRLSNLPYP